MNSQNKNAEDTFDKFIISSDLKDILSAFNQLCDLLDLNPSENSSSFYKSLKIKLKNYWKAQTLFNKLDKKVLQKEYRNQSACPNIKALVIGCGPCGLRCAIELALLGARVVVIDKRESFSRNNVLHLWPFVIDDLKALGAKIFFGMFCAGSIDHISIRRLQCILFKVALLFGVQFFVGVTFQSLILPNKTYKLSVSGKGDTENNLSENESNGWRPQVIPEDHIISSYEFNTIVGADGKTNILGFPRKELRCRLAIAITGNFINKNTSEEAQVEEISGVAFIFNQQYFKDIYKKTGIDLENIVYYKDETHYFVMTAKKHSLLSKGVLKKDSDDPEFLLHPNNVNYKALENYTKEAANVATDYKIPNLEFSKNHRNEPDVAMFNFTHMFAAENASKVVEREGVLLLEMLVGDSLLEPFWPTGSGCALGFLSSLDAAWLVRRMGMINNALEQNKISTIQQKMLILEAIAERESVYQRLSQTTSSNMPQNFNKYTLNPRTRYSQCKMNCIDIPQILHLYDTDDKSKKILSIKNEYVNNNKAESQTKQNQFASLSSPKLMGLNLSFSNSFKDTSIINRDVSNSTMKGEYMLRWFQIRLDRYFNLKSFKVDDLSKSWNSGVPFLCLIHLYNPDSIDLSSINHEDKFKNLETAFKLFDREFHVVNPFNALTSLENLDPMAIFLYLEKIYETLRVLNPNRSTEEIYDLRTTENRKMKKRFVPKSLINTKHEYEAYYPKNNIPMKPTHKIFVDSIGINDIEKGIIEMRKKEILRLYTSNYKEPPSVVKGPTNRSIDKTDNAFSYFANTKVKDSKIKTNDKFPTKICEKFKMVVQTCHFCKTRIFQGNYDTFENYVFHKYCFRCQYCKKDLNNQQFKLLKSNHESEEKFYCLRHFEKLSNISFIREKNVSNILRDILLKEDKKHQKLSTRDVVKYKNQSKQEKKRKIKKPRYSLKDFGCPVKNNQISILPVQCFFDKTLQLSQPDIETYLKKTLLNLKRINDESDENYDGSLDESSNRLLSLDIVEPLDENQFSWTMCFNKQDLEYAMKKCQVIRKNRLIYKKYKSKDESTSSESEINMLIQDICKTSDEDILDDVIYDINSDKNVEISKSEIISNDNLKDEQQPIDDNVIIRNGIPHLELSEKDNIPTLLENDNLQFNGNNLGDQEIKSHLIDDNTTGVNNKVDNSRNLRQMAKLKFCTEPPKPVSINPKEFISQINRTKMILVDIPCCFETAECFPSVNDIFLTVDNHRPTDFHSKIKIQEKSLLYAEFLSINSFGSSVKNTGNLLSDIALNTSGKTNLVSSSANQAALINKCKVLQNIFSSDIYDFKDIDSLSINTEDSCVTHTENFSENENVSLKLKSNRKATLDSEFDISLAMSSNGEIPVENKCLSSNSLDSVMSSLTSSMKSSGISASSESDGEIYCDKKSDMTKKNIDKQSKLYQNYFFSEKFKLDKTGKYNQQLNCDGNYFHSVNDEFIECSENQMKEQSVKNSMTVTPPHDIELDDNQIKCLEVDSQFPFVMENEIRLKNFDCIGTKFQRVNNIHKQLENIENRLNDIEFKESNFKDDISNTRRPSDKFTNETFPQDSNNNDNKEIDDRIVMDLCT